MEKKNLVILALAAILCFSIFTFAVGENDIDQLLEARVRANDDGARAAIKLITTAIESYRLGNNRKYPEKEEALLSEPPYYTEPFNGQHRQGYIFSLELSSDGYKIIATPEECKKTGNKVFIAKSLKDSMPTEEDFKNKTPEELENLMKAYLGRDPYELTEEDCEKSQ